MTSISSLPSQTGAGAAAADLFVTVDVSDTSLAPTGTDKSLSLLELQRAIAPAWSTFAAATAQGGSLATTGYAKFQLVGKTMHVSAFLVAANAGTLGNAVVLGLPSSTDSPNGYQPAIGTSGMLGLGYLFAFTGPTGYVASCYYASGTTSPAARFRRADQADANDMGVSPNQAFGVGGSMQVNLTYEVL